MKAAKPLTSDVRPRSFKRVGTLFVGCLVAASAAGVCAALAADQTWSGGATGNGTGWTTAANWSGGAFPGSQSVTTNADVATIPATGANPAIGINMNFGGNTFYLGAINLAGGSRAVGNSSTTAGGTLQLNGATVNSAANVILRNSGAGTLTLQAFQSGAMGVALGNQADNVVQIDGSGGVNISAVISGPGRRLTLGGAGAGALTLSGANTYGGETRVGRGRLALTGSGSIANSSAVEVAGGATFDVSGLTSALTLAAGQALRAGGTTSSGTIATAAGKGLTLAADSPLQFTAFNGAAPPLTVAGAGTLTLASGNAVTVRVANGGNPLGVGDYTLISKGAGGGVAGAVPAALAVTGDGIAPGTVASLRMTGQQLVLRVARPGTLQFSSAAYSAGEAGGRITLEVTRAGGDAGAVSVAYATGGGTASAGADYAAATGTLDWAAGDSSVKVINIALADDRTYEGDETFAVTLNSPGGGATLGTPSAATVTVADDETQPAVSVSDVALAEPVAGVSYASFVVTLSNASTQSVSASYSTADGTAVAPGDYAPLSGAVGFSPGETSKTVAVAVKADALAEPDETFSLNLAGPAGATLGDVTGVATVTAPVPPGAVLIGEFRLRGPAGAADEFVELYNNTDADIVVADANPATCAPQVIAAGPAAPCGWALLDQQGAAAGNVPRFVIPAGRTIPARGRYLVAGGAYSLSALAAPDLTYDPPAYAGGEADQTGLALYKTADRARFTQANLFDAVGFGGAAPGFKEGAGLPPSGGVTADAQHSFVRNQGSGRPADTGDNRADFTLVAADPPQVADAAAVLGAPGPESGAGAVQRNAGFAVSVPPGVSSSVRRTSPAVTNGALGTLSLRRRFTNNTGQALSKLRFRAADLSTWNSRQIFANQAELRLLDATLVGLSGTGLLATGVETPPQQSQGGGVNTGLVVGGSLVLARPLAPGQSVDVEFLLGVMKGGSYQFVVTVEAAP